MRINLATWNILAECYNAKSSKSFFSPVGTDGQQNGSYIEWDDRRQLLEQCFKDSSLDIYCLQEVDHFVDFYQDMFERQNYEAIYLQRPGGKQDGCVIAFRREKFRLLAREDIDLDRLAYLDNHPGNQKLGVNKFCKQNVALFTLLESKQTAEKFIIATCHIHWNPNLPEVKFAQVQYILEELSKFQQVMLQQQTTDPSSSSTATNASTAIPVLITGDFNSFPHDEIYSFVTNPDDQVHAVEIYQNKFHLSFAMKKSINELYGPHTKFLCDLSLSRLCRWLRMLGVDAALDSWDQPATSTGISDALIKEHDLGMSFASTREDMIQAQLAQMEHMNGTNSMNNETSTTTTATTTIVHGTDKIIPEEHVIVADAFHMIPLNRLSNTTTTTVSATAVIESKEKNNTTVESPVNSDIIETPQHDKVAPHHVRASSSVVRNDVTNSVSVRSMTTTSTHPTNTNANNPNKLKKQDRMNNINAFFQRARDEKRVILTSSRSLIQRNTCPQSYCVNPSLLEKELVNIYREFGLDLKKERFLTVCGKCGGEIIEADLADPRLLGKIIPTDRVVFICKTCGQVRNNNTNLFVFYCILI